MFNMCLLVFQHFETNTGSMYQRTYNESHFAADAQIGCKLWDMSANYAARHGSTKYSECAPPSALRD